MFVVTLNTQYEKAYNEFLLRNEHSLLYASVNYKLMLEAYLKCESNYLLVLEGKRVLGVFPMMLKRNRKYGNVMNSLPFFGSYGGIFVDESIDDGLRDRVRAMLLDP